MIAAFHGSPSSPLANGNKKHSFSRMHPNTQSQQFCLDNITKNKKPLESVIRAKQTQAKKKKQGKYGASSSLQECSALKAAAEAEEDDVEKTTEEEEQSTENMKMHMRLMSPEYEQVTDEQDNKDFQIFSRNLSMDECTRVQMAMQDEMNKIQEICDNIMEAHNSPRKDNTATAVPSPRRADEAAKQVAIAVIACTAADDMVSKYPKFLSYNKCIAYNSMLL